MFFTARQLESLHRESGANGQLVLPYRARLTPGAQDWVKHAKLTLGYSDDVGAPFRGRSQNAVSVAVTGLGPGIANATAGTTSSPASPDLTPVPAAGPTLWWCDGPCGAAKGAIMAQAKESPFRPVELPADPKQVAAAVKAIAGELKAGSAATAVMVVGNAAVATVYANRCPSIRAVVGTSLEAVEQGVQLVAANVLVVEHANKTLHQVKTLLARFAKAKRELTPDVRRQLAELASC